MKPLATRLQQLAAPEYLELLRSIRHGIEKEGLRVDTRGRIAQTPHQPGLGAALTNPRITTDYSEALLEFITPVFTDVAQALDYLADLHRFTYPQLEGETIWGASMPCALSGPEEVPIARYGSSNSGRLKHIYRVGLDHRYGRVMQTIAGIHYNFSLPEGFWHAYRALTGRTGSDHDLQSEGYFALIRNFRRWSWLLFYLFGASPALSRSFIEQPDDSLQALDAHTLYAPWATTLRMSDLGYSNQAQSLLNICYNNLDSYLYSLDHAIHTPYPAYEAIGVKVDGEYRQLNSHILQIENEYYSDIRPKRVMAPGQKPIQALSEGGVEYVEVRSLDINPLLPIGIDLEQARFLDTFLLFCLLAEGDAICDRECERVKANQARVARRGREPGLMLETSGGVRPLKELGLELLEQMQGVAELLDSAHAGQHYQQALAAQRAKLEDPQRTPSAQVLDALKTGGLSYVDYVLAQSRAHQATLLAEGLDAGRREEFERLARDSHAQQQAMESSDDLSFDAYLAQFLGSTGERGA